MHAHEFDLIGVGSPIVDSLAHVPDAFVEALSGAKGGMELVNAATMAEMIEKLDSAPKEAAGGSAGNTAAGVARLGGRVTFLGKLGNDSVAEYYRDRFAAVGGDTGRFKVGNVPNARCLSLVTPDSERTMRTDLGAAALLSPDEVSVADFEGVRHAHIEGYLLFNEALLMKVLQSAKAAGCTISIDLASFEVVRAAGEKLRGWLEEYVDIVFANEEEAAAFMGDDPGHDREQAMQALNELAKICNIAVVKLGAQGSLVRSGGETHRIAAVEVEKVEDTTGAGDLWAAGFLQGWLAGEDLAECGRRGSLVGASVVQVLGAELKEEEWQRIRREIMIADR